LINRANDQLTNVDEVDFALFLPEVYPVSIESSGDGEIDAERDFSNVFEIEISISPCLFDFDGPDIEHYRQRAAEMTALPDTM
jgi:hypothetical protein